MMRTIVLKSVIFTTLLSLAGTGNVHAQEPSAEVPPPPPVIPEGFDEQGSIEADVVIRKGKDEVIEEYRINGELYMVRITPKVGKPYYIRYPDGPQGPVIRKELSDINTPFWKLFEW